MFKVWIFFCLFLSNFFYSKDTFDAHVKGQKHQRTIALLRRMGKPVPQIDLDNIGANLTTKAQGKPIPTVGTSGPLKKVVGVTGTKFVGGTTLLTTGEEYKMGTNAATAVTGAMKPQDLEVFFLKFKSFISFCYFRKHCWVMRMLSQLVKNLLKKTRIHLENSLHTCVSSVTVNSVILTLRTFILKEDVIVFNIKYF